MPDRVAVLAHPLRDRVLRAYREGPAAAADVARALELPLNVVSYHTRVLAEAGCLALVSTERRRGARTRIWRALVEQYIEDDHWTGVAAPQRRRLALDALGQASEEARAAALAGGFDVPHWHLSRTPATLDDQGVDDVSALLRRVFDEIADIAAASRDRGGERRPYRVVLWGFESGDRSRVGSRDAAIPRRAAD